MDKLPADRLAEATYRASRRFQRGWREYWNPATKQGDWVLSAVVVLAVVGCFWLIFTATPVP